MAISARKLGPGTLTLGAGAIAPSAQLTACKVTPAESVEAGERIKTLTHETLDAADTVTIDYTMSGTFLQDDPGAASIVDYTWDHAGEDIAFVFSPNTAAGREVNGTVRIVPLTIGGDDVDGYMTSDFTWACTGADPTLT